MDSNSASRLVADFTDRQNTTQRVFTIDDDTFICAKAIPAGVGRILASLNEADPLTQFDGMGTVLDMIMLPDSAQLFAKRMNDPEKPITLKQVNEVLKWLMSEYGSGDGEVRPTTPPNGSLPSPEITGPNLMAGPPPEVQIS